MTTMSPVRPLPEALGRKDTPKESGEWSVNECAPIRGLPVTNVSSRKMSAPMGNDALSEVVRVHELVHAKVSPTDLSPYLERGLAGDDSLRSVEEMRVNYLASRLGYDMKHLMDGSEDSYGERVVDTNDWRGAVMFALATAGTGGHKKFLNGVRRKNKVWGAVLADISKRAMKEITKVPQKRLASTEPIGDGMIEGFSHTERIAEWAERMATTAPPEPEPAKGEDEGKGGDTDKGDTTDDGDTEASKPKRGRPKSSEVDTTDAVSASRKTKLLPSSPPSWMKLKVERLPLPIVLNGALGKKRLASQTGKVPRRIHRLISDPNKRVFDRTVKGTGGIVIVDASGSMSMSRDELREVVLSAPGCTVMTYSVMGDWRIGEDGEAVATNAWVLADKGRICDEMPFSRGQANGVDLPALEWAVSNRPRSNTPIVWVCDGHVTGMGDNGHDSLTLQAMNFCSRHNIVVVPDTATACKYLTALGQGKRMSVREPWAFTDARRQYLGGKK